MERWLTYEAAVALIGDWAGIPKGAALPKLDEAIASKTIRGRSTPEANMALLIENGFCTFGTPPDELQRLQKTMENWEPALLNVNFDLSIKLGHYLISEGDLQYWLERHLPRQTSAVKKHVRYANDAALIAEGIKKVQDGKWPNANQAALELAPRAEGAETAKVDRLRRAIRKGLGK
jgi:hypothetical protein